MGKRVMLCTSYGNGASPDGALSYSQLAKMPQHNVCDLSEEEEDDDGNLFQLKKQQDVVIVPGIQKRRSRRSRRETMQQKRLAEVQQEKEMSRRIVRSPQVELMRELTAAVKKVRSLQDPSTLSSFDTLLEEDNSRSCVTGVSSRNNNNAAAAGAGMMMMATTLGNELSQPLVAKKKKTRRSSKIRRGRGGGVGVGDHHQLSNRQWRLGGAPAAAGSSDGAGTLAAGCRITTQEIGGKDGNAAKGKEYRDGAPAADGGDRGGAAEAGGSVQAQAIVDLNGRREGNDRRCYDDDDESPQQCAPRRVEKEAYRYGDGGEGGQGDDEDDAENNARRLMMMSETRLLPCAPYPHHSFYVSELTSPAYDARTLQGLRDRQGQEEEERWLESQEEEGKHNSSVVQEESVEEEDEASSRISNSASPFGRRGDPVKKKKKTTRQNGLNLRRVCSSSHVRRRSKSQKSSSGGGDCYGEEARIALTKNVDDDDDEPEVSSRLPRKQQPRRRGGLLLLLRCYWSRLLRKYKAKTKNKRLFFAFLRSRGCFFASCVFPVGKKKKRINKKENTKLQQQPQQRGARRNGSRSCAEEEEAAPASNNTTTEKKKKKKKKKSPSPPRPLHSYLGGVLQQGVADRDKKLQEMARSRRRAGERPSRRRSAAAVAISSQRKLSDDREGGPPQGFLAEKEEEEAQEQEQGLQHQRLCHKYRPKSFKDLVGQTLVVRSLVSAITKGRVAPVYLFSGPRGTGKTSAARVFAAALVCLATEPHRRPCGLCKECTASFALNMSFHVREVNAANELEIEHMRALLSSMSSSPFPSHSRYQVFIVEGCDFLTPEMWRTFLKFLEDPPPDIVLILITTNPERLPLTATSRCQKFLFGKVKDAEIMNRLQMLAAKENLEVDVAALSLIASRADGSLRDAEGTLDQLSLLDNKVSLAIVQELVGLIPDDMLLDLLDLALSADAVNTVRCTRELLDLGVDALSLVAQLASLITNILGGSFDIHREMRSKGGFFRRDLCREEQHQLRQALKILLESEKQLRVSHDRPTWLTAALLQFAPDRSYVPSSVDTTQSEAKVHPAHSPLLKARNSSSEEVLQSSSNLLYDGHQVLAKSCDFHLLGHGELKDVWTKVLHSYRSDVLRQLMQAEGSLVSLSVANDNTYAVAHVEFQHPEHKARAERLQSGTCHAFQVALGCPVELNFRLARLQETILEDSKEHLQYDSIADSREDSPLSSSKKSELIGPISKVCAGKSLSKSSEVLGCPPDLKHGSLQNQQLEGTTGQPPVYSGNPDHQGFQSHRAGLDKADKIQSQTFKVHKPMKQKTLKLGSSRVEINSVWQQFKVFSTSLYHPAVR
ncbi:unnamed protein product [Sphagnum jensenii]|uniref:AAA+ ATPase domain-containing protein n=1 Tax=Sphagnum jensenii TaxID=128206 RepID=A0ABP0WMF2_9BRYO